MIDEWWRLNDEGSKQSWIADGQTCEGTDIFECRVTFAAEESQLKIRNEITARQATELEL